MLGECDCCGVPLIYTWSILCECGVIFHVCHSCYMYDGRFSPLDKKGIIHGDCKACLRDKMIGELLHDV